MEESITYLKNLRISPKKLRFYISEIRKMKPSELKDNLYYERTAAGKILYKAVQSAISNAKTTLKADENMLRFKLFTIEEGNKIKRFRPGGRGTPKPIVKRRSHIKIILEVKEGKKEGKEVKKVAESKLNKSQTLNPKPETNSKK